MKERLKREFLKEKAHRLDFLIVPLSQIYHKPIRKWLVILKLEDQGQKRP